MLSRPSEKENTKSTVWLSEMLSDVPPLSVEISSFTENLDFDRKLNIKYI